MTELQKWQEVNQCETPQGLGFLIISLADDKGMIQGRERKFDASRMATALQIFMEDEAPANVLTREFGIRQQAIYLKSLNK
jgi:hypothetical protein